MSANPQKGNPTRHHRGESNARFGSPFERWLVGSQPWCSCAVAEVGDQLIGMAWLVVYQRVTNPSQFDRATGDIQSVYVRPNYRHRGVGRALVQLMIDEGERRGVDRFTVDSNDRALRFYQRQGFATRASLLQRSAR